MPEYEYNDDKREKLLTGYNTVRGAELKEIYQVLARQGDVSVSVFEKRFARPDSDGFDLNTDHVDQCLKFLQTVDMVEISAQSVVSLMNQAVYPDIDAFEPRLLHHIRQQEGKQYHLAYVFDVAVGLDNRRVPEEELLEAVVDDGERSFGFSWNEHNIRMWANLADHLGAVSYLNRQGRDRNINEILVSPTRRLLADLLDWYSTHGEDSTRFVRALEWIDKEFLPIFSTRRGTPTVAIGVADVLNDMVSDGALSLRAMSDTEEVVELPRSGQGGTREIATFEFDGRPDRPSYSYPLARDEEEVIA